MCDTCGCDGEETPCESCSMVEAAKQKLARRGLVAVTREVLVAADSELSAIGHHRQPDKEECLRISNALREAYTRADKLLGVTQ